MLARTIAKESPFKACLHYYHSTDMENYVGSFGSVALDGS